VPFVVSSRLELDAFVDMVLSVTVMPSSVDVPDTDSAVVVVVPETCNAVVGSEVPIPILEFVTSRYKRFVSNARSVPLRVRLDFSTEPDIRPMAIPGTPYNNVSVANATHGLPIIADRQQYGYLCA